MSEYQYYEFRAVDRPLTAAEMAALRRISSRATITPSSFVNTYNYGDLRGDPENIIAKYFDAFVYVANWGTHEFSVRLRKDALKRREYGPYCRGGGVEAKLVGEFLLLRFIASELESDWEEGEEWMDSLLPLRADLLGGDLRALYLGWLAGVGRELEDDEPEPPVPAGLRTLSEPLVQLVEFLEIDEDLLAVAAEHSADLPDRNISRESFAEWVSQLPGGEKDALLVAIAMGETPQAGADLMRRFRRAMPRGKQDAVTTGRTAGELTDAVSERAKAREMEEVARAAAERSRVLDVLGKNEPEAWRKVEEWVARKQQSEYDNAVALLKDLRDVAVREGRMPEFQHRLRDIARRHAGKRTFVQRLERAGMSPGAAD